MNEQAPFPSLFRLPRTTFSATPLATIQLRIPRYARAAIVGEFVQQSWCKGGGDRYIFDVQPPGRDGSVDEWVDNGSMIFKVNDS